MTHFPLYVIVFLSGSSVLAIEILGTRILGPFYGVSLFLWSALITVTLAALSVGYLLGGRWADRGPTYKRLGLALGGAGLWTLAIPWLRDPVLHLSEPLGLRAAVLVTSTVLFFVPLMLLGMTSPYAIRLRADRLQTVGRTAGDIYAVSTIASVLAALLTGFFLIPNVGVFRLTMLIGGGLLIAALIAFLTGRGRVAAVAALLLAAGAGVGSTWAPGESADPLRGLVEMVQSPYAEIRVVDWEDTRLLLIDGGGHTIVEPGTWKSLYPYVIVLDILKFMFDEPGDMVVVGLGGGSVVKSFYRSGWGVDAVEIDPKITEIAYDHFGLEESEADVHHRDGRQYFITHDKTYDIVILDAFGSSSIPFHLVTTEAFALIRSRMDPDGILALNIEGVGWHDILARSLTRTLKEHFREVWCLPLAEPPNRLGNIVVLASNRSLEFPEDMLGHPRDFLDDRYLHWVALTRIHAWDNRFEADIAGVPRITDDLNRVDLWAERINLEARRALHSEFEWKHLGW
jgi:predicted membrane-bound spermidine synthase